MESEPHGASLLSLALPDQHPRVADGIALHPRPAALDDIPDADLDHLADQGSDSPWFLSIWQTALAGQRISRSHPEWRGEFQETLPDLREGDIADMCTDHRSTR
jgi:hypothetical protein